MAKSDLSTLLPLMRLRGCNQPTMLQALRNANKRFCIDTELWEEDLATILTVADQADYTLTPGHTNTFIQRVNLVTIDGTELGETQWSVKKDGAGMTLTLESIPDTDDLDIIVEVVYIPTELCTKTDTAVITRYGLAIAKGAEAYLKADPVSSKEPVPWFDPNGAAVAESSYQDGVFNAKLEKFESNQSGLQPPEQPGFFL